MPITIDFNTYFDRRFSEEESEKEENVPITIDFNTYFDDESNVYLSLNAFVPITIDFNTYFDNVHILRIHK